MSVGPYVFSVKTALLTADLGPNDIVWQVRIWAEEGALAGEIVEPYAYSENLLPLYGKRFSKWQDVLREEISWAECYNEEHGEMNASLNLHVHDCIDNGLIRFTDPEDLCFRVKWTGDIDTSAAEAFEGFPEIKFTCEAEMRFEGIVVRGLTRDQARAKMAEWITDQEFHYHGTQGDDSLIFLPR
jgi:hypothetical protein